MDKIKPGLDIILDILKAAQEAFPTSSFIESLLFQYQERGSLSKKQLEGLYSKAGKMTSLPPGKLATLEAILLKMPNRFKSPPPVSAPDPGKDAQLDQWINDILLKYPQHKRVRFIKSKLDNNEPVTALEKAEIAKFHKLLIG